jgi:hypothetical protein
MRVSARPAAQKVLVAGAVLLGFVLQIALLAREPGSPLQTLLARARSRSYTSYHTVALSPEARRPTEFLRHHADLLPTWARSAKHAATHPPGPVLFYRGLLALCRSAPRLTEGLLAAAGLPPRGSPPSASRPARAAALLGALVLGLLGALAAWPTFRLAAGLGVEGASAARLAVLWTLLPGPALQVPQFDQALALPIVAAAGLLLRAGQARSLPTAAGRAVLAGVLGGLALFVSYGSVAFLVIASVAALAGAGVSLRRSALLAGVAAAVAALVAFGLPALSGHDPARALLTALSIHREIYTAPRDYAAWLLFNPLDFALFTGLPVAVTGLLLLPGALRGVTATATTDPITRFRLATLTGLTGLLVLGVTRGEVGRIWIPLMPLVLVASLGGPSRPSRVEALVDGALLAAFTFAMGSYWVI